MHRRLQIALIATVAMLGTGWAAEPVAPWRPSPTGAALRSLVIPGWGQLYNRTPIKAVIVGGVEEGFLYAIYQNHRLFRYYSGNEDPVKGEFYRDQRNRLTWYLTESVILSVMQAYVDAHLYGFDVSDQLSLGKTSRGLTIAGIMIIPGVMLR